MSDTLISVPAIVRTKNCHMCNRETTFDPSLNLMKIGWSATEQAIVIESEWFAGKDDLMGLDGGPGSWVVLEGNYWTDGYDGVVQRHFLCPKCYGEMMQHLHNHIKTKNRKEIF